MTKPGSSDVQPSAGTPAWRLSGLAATAATAVFGVGMLSGLAIYLTGVSEDGPQQPGTTAWIPHLVLAAAGLLWLVVAIRRPRSPGARLLLHPLGRPAVARLAATLRAGLHPVALLRDLAVAVLVLVMAYAGWRAGVQVTAGLDSNFTTNAWGGPSYLGAMFCHYVDAALMIAVPAALNRLLLPVR
jgi:hypothetical protein